MIILRPRPGSQLAWSGDLSGDLPTQHIPAVPSLPVRSPGEALATERAAARDAAITPSKASRETLAQILEVLENL